MLKILIDIMIIIYLLVKNHYKQKLYLLSIGMFLYDHTYKNILTLNLAVNKYENIKKYKPTILECFLLLFFKYSFFVIVFGNSYKRIR